MVILLTDFNCNLSLMIFMMMMSFKASILTSHHLGLLCDYFNVRSKR